ncbi:MAG: substrate-binding domain-containing protein [Nakamurella sp.]
MAGWLVATVIGVVVALAAGITWVVFLNSDSGSGVVDTTCTGRTRIDIAAGGAAPGLRAVAAAFNATAPEARGRCLSAQINQVAATQVADALPSGWTGQASPLPVVWIPDTPADVASVAATAPELVAGYNDAVIASSPVVLAVTGGPAPGASPSWSELLTAVAGGSAPALADGTPFTLAVGDPRLDPATAYALESMIAVGDAAVTTADVQAATDRLLALAGRSAVSSTAADLLDDLAVGSLTFSAVPALEATVLGYNADAATPLQVLRPSGPTAGDQLTAIALSASWVGVDQAEGAAAFIKFLRSPVATTLLQQAGWRVPGTTATTTDGIDPAVPVTVLEPSGDRVAVALASALGLLGVPASGTDPGTGSAAPTTP